MARKKFRRSKARARSGAGRRASSRRSVSRASRRPARRKAAQKKASSARASTRSAPKRRGSTASAMRRALAMKIAREQKQDMTPHWPTQSLSEHAPDRTPQNPREQGDTANILQNTTNRLLQR